MGGFAFTTQNEIVDIRSPRDVHETQTNRFSTYSQRPGPNTDGTRPESVDQQIDHVPGDDRVSALPIPCQVEWEERLMRARTEHEYTRAGMGSCPYTKHRANFVLVPGAVVRFKKQPPGRFDAWFRIKSVKGTEGLLQSYSSLIEFELEQIQGVPA